MTANAEQPAARSAPLVERRDILITILVLVGLAVGIALQVAGNGRAADLVWGGSILVVLGPLAWEIAGTLREGRVGVDVIALLAMVGALLAGEQLAGSVIALMLAGGGALEEYARGRAGTALRGLVERAPRTARLQRGDEIVEVDVEDVVVGDVVVVRRGEIVPVDGIMLTARGVLDESNITGESLPVDLAEGGLALSGAANAGDAFVIRAMRTSEESMYGSIIRLVREALGRTAPMVRLADRFAVFFLVVTLVLAGGAWILSGSGERALAVLVIATPCPLILAPPVALVAGTSRAARRGIIVKGAAAIERLGTVRAVLVDKTGTITLGVPEVVRVDTADGGDPDRLLHLAGSVEQLSVHSLADAIVRAARQHGPLGVPSDVGERPGSGISATVDGHRVVVGSQQYLRDEGIAVGTGRSDDGTTTAHVAVDGTWAGTVVLGDQPRADAARIAPRLHEVGVRRVAMATGDHEAVARRVAAGAGIDEVHADCTPQRKLEIVERMRREVGGAVAMVGDGVNDAPALAAADVGMAMGGAGATAASDTADVVILAAGITRVADAIALGRRCRRIALQSVIAGMALSSAGMVVAALGYLPPLAGALAQEGIDLAVILNAMRGLWGGDLGEDA